MSKHNKETLYRALKRQILTMALQPGENLDETSLGKHYKLSRTPVREVLRGMAGEGYLEITQNRGAAVSPMNYKMLRDFFRTAPPVYASIAALAAENRTPEQLSALKASQRRFCKAVSASDPGLMAYYNNDFHLIIGEMADNQYLWPSLQRLSIDHARIAHTFYRANTSDMKARLNTAREHHDQFIDAIEQRDAKKAKQLAIDHWDLSRDHIEMFVRADPLKIDLAVA
jgi:DNA-binding GntR family transcriptional regulator